MSSPQSENHGDPAAKLAAELLVEEHALSVGRVCMALLGTQREAEEVLRETLQAALDESESCTGVGSRGARLVSMARKLCARRIELRAREPKPQRGSTLEEAISRDERRSGARGARRLLDDVRPTEREALVLRFTAGLDFVEIARACGTDEGDIRRRISRGLMRLRALSSEDER